VAGEGRHLVSQIADLLQVGEVGEQSRRSLSVIGLRELGGGSVKLVAAAAMEDQLRAIGGETGGQGTAEAVGCAGDEDRAGVGHVSRGEELLRVSSLAHSPR
jgi:hypothetical protein